LALIAAALAAAFLAAAFAAVAAFLLTAVFALAAAFVAAAAFLLDAEAILAAATDSLVNLDNTPCAFSNAGLVTFAAGFFAAGLRFAFAFALTLAMLDFLLGY
jgi:hypothetical protein